MQINIFNKLLSFDSVNDPNNIVKTIILLKPKNYNIKFKFKIYELMEDKSKFYKAQRIYHILYRFVQKCKITKMKIFNVDCDLRMAPFNPTTMIQLSETKCIYTFNIYDLINVILTSLSQQSHMFVNPQPPKNPYTNIHFRINNLYNIYIKCRELNITVPPLLSFFYECEFDIDMLKQKYKKNLTEYAIKTYLAKDAPITTNIIEDIYDICDEHYIKLHSEFPKKELYEIFRPYLKYHYNCNIYNCEDEMSYILDCFELYNPFFGRKYKTSDNQIGFDNRHLKINELRDIFSTVQNTKIFNKLNANKYKTSEIFCVSLQPLQNVSYFDLEEMRDDINDIYEDSEEEYD